MEFVSHAARISDQCGCAAPQRAARAWRCWALLGAVAVLHSYTIKSPIYFVTCFRHPSNKQQVAIQVQNIHYDIL